MKADCARTHSLNDLTEDCHWKFHRPTGSDWILQTDAVHRRLPRISVWVWRGLVHFRTSVTLRIVRIRVGVRVRVRVRVRVTEVRKWTTAYHFAWSLRSWDRLYIQFGRWSFRSLVTSVVKAGFKKICVKTEPGGFLVLSSVSKDRPDLATSVFRKCCSDLLS